VSERAPGAAPAAVEPATTEADVLREIRRIAREELELDAPISADDRLDGPIALDSLSRTVLAVGLEDRFRVRLEEDDALAPTVGGLARRVAARVRAARAQEQTGEADDARSAERRSPRTTEEG
jgi:acyl carrier protein